MIIGNNKTALLIFFVMMSSCAYSMDTENKIISESIDSEEEPFLAFSGSLMNYVPTSMLWNAYNKLTTTAESLYITTKIQLSDDIAFIKLGYPIDNTEAQNELKNVLKNYKAYRGLIKSSADIKAAYHTDPTVRDDFLRLKNYVARRQTFVERAAESLPNRIDGELLAKHCLEYHKLVMSPLLKGIIASFVLLKQKSQTEAVEGFSEQLSQLTPDKEKNTHGNNKKDKDKK